LEAPWGALEVGLVEVGLVGVVPVVVDPCPERAVLCVVVVLAPLVLVFALPPELPQAASSTLDIAMAQIDAVRFMPSSSGRRLPLPSVISTQFPDAPERRPSA
jgi:hypothetical protein